MYQRQPEIYVKHYSVPMLLYKAAFERQSNVYRGLGLPTQPY